MKRILLTSAICYLTSYVLFSQHCGTLRYDTEIFPAVTKTADVVYGQNLDLNNSMKVLKMDVYEPTGDVASQRPLIIFAHGGSFIGGSKADADQVNLCTRCSGDH
jgi:carboxylesterase type B